MSGAEFDIRVRPFRSAHVPSVARLLPNSFIGPEGNAVAFDAAAACEALLREGAMTGAVLTSGDAASASILAAGAAVFVDDGFLEEQKTAPYPGVTERVLYAALQPNSPVLRPAAISRANAGDGLNVVVVLHTWDRAKVGSGLEREIRLHLTKAFLDDFRGYRLREILTDVFGDEELRWAFAGGGFVLRRSYDEWYRQAAQPCPRRYLVGVTREEALDHEGSVLAMLFHYREPVCGFTSSERRLLHVAVGGATDAEIAAALGISLSAVKKRWAAIFHRVGARLPELITPAVADAGAADELTRGPQKRHKLLAYLRERPEEIRP